MSENTPNFAPVKSPKVDITHGPGRLYFARCRNCDWTSGLEPSGVIRDQATTHRWHHRTGQVQATR
jgi:hypothetical protein